MILLLKKLDILLDEIFGSNHFMNEIIWPRTIGGTSFDGTANIAVATATEATNVTVSANNSTDETVYPVFVDGATSTQGIESDSGFTYNPNTGTLTSLIFVGSFKVNKRKVFL